MGLFDSLGGLLGIQTGAAPQLAPIQNPVNQQQIAASQAGVNNGLSGQQSLLNALNQANGIGNQSQVYNQLQGVANGTGPNPAQAMLNNATGQNVANQAALMAGQRGTGANAGLLARQAAMQGANTQQQAAGQGAALQAQQSLAAMGQAGQIAGNQANQQIEGTNANTTANLQNQQALLGANAAYNNALTSGQNNVNSVNGTLAGNAETAGLGGIGGLLNGAGALGAMSGAFGKTAQAAQAGTALFAAHGGMIPSKVPNFIQKRMASGGKVPAMVSPGEAYLSPAQARAAAGNPERTKQEIEKSGKIPGKAVVKGDSLKNDVVSKTLDSGGVVIPRSVINKNDPKAAAKFLAEALSKKGKK